MLYEGGYRKFLDLVRGRKVRPGSLVYMVRSVKHHVYREDKAVEKEGARSECHFLTLEYIFVTFCVFAD